MYAYVRIHEFQIVYEATHSLELNGWSAACYIVQAKFYVYSF